MYSRCICSLARDCPRGTSPFWLTSSSWSRLSRDLGYVGATGTSTPTSCSHRAGRRASVARFSRRLWRHAATAYTTSSWSGHPWYKVAGVQLVHDIGGRPHRPVRLIVASAVPRGKVRVLHRPRPISADLPPTAAQRPPSYGGVLVVNPQQDSIERAAASWFRLAEQEFRHLRGCVACDGDGFDGRAAKPRFQWKSLDGPPTGGWAGATTLSIAWRAVASWCLTLGKALPTASVARQRRLHSCVHAFQGICNSLNRRVGGDDKALDFQAIILMLMPDKLGAPHCMLFAYRAASKVAKELEVTARAAALKRWKRTQRQTSGPHCGTKELRTASRWRNWISILCLL